MSKLIVALLAAIPGLAGATPLLVEYEATINYVADECWCGELGYHEGDRLAGKLEIDTDRATVRLPGLTPRQSLWGAAGGEDFISGGGPPQRPGHPLGADQILVTDGAAWSPPARGGDIYAIEDHMRIAGGGDNLLFLHMDSFDADFVHGLGPVQTFDSRDAEKEGPVKFFASLTGHLRGMSYYVGLQLTRLKVSAGGQCHL